MSDRIESFKRALAGLIERRESEFSNALADHVTQFSIGGRSGSGMDVVGRLEVARVAYKGAVVEAMENALTFSKAEGVAVPQLLMTMRPPITEFGQRIADAISFRAMLGNDVDRLRAEFAALFDNAVRDALKGRVGFTRILPLPLHRAAINAVRDNPWLLIAPILTFILGLAVAYFGLK